MVYRIRYKTYTATVSGTKPKKCQVCGKTPKLLQGHHTCYEYPVAQVRKNPDLAKQNVIWLCYHCHRIANALRVVFENKWKSDKLMEII